MQHRQIVIVGGGVAGLDLASHLAGSQARRLGLDIHLVDREPAHAWNPMLHMIAAGTADTHGVQASFLAQARKRGFRFHPGEVIAVDRGRREISLAPLMMNGIEVMPQRSIAYDTLILAVGSSANDFDTPGVAEHCMTIDCRREALSFNDHLRVNLVRALARGQPLSIAIVGGGATGVELAAELVRLAEIVEQHDGSGAKADLQVTLVEAQKRILAPFPESAAITAPARATDLDADDYSAGALPVGTNLALVYLQHVERDQVNVDGDKVANGNLDSDVAILRYAHFVKIGPFLADPQFLLPIGRLRGRADQRGLGSSGTQVGDLILAATIWLHNDPKAGQYFGVTPFIYVPVGMSSP